MNWRATACISNPFYFVFGWCLILVYLLRTFLLTAIQVFQILLLVRIIISWIGDFRVPRLYQFCFRLTEPVLYPIRKFLSKFDVFNRIPIDFSYIVVYLLMRIAVSII